MARCLGTRVVGACVCIVFAAAQQAGEPARVNVEYDVPSTSADAALAMLRHSAALEAKLVTPKSHVHSLRGSGFAAFGQSSDGVPPEDEELVLHVAAPSVGTARGVALASSALSRLASLSDVSQRLHSQESRALRGAKALLQHSASFVSDDAPANAMLSGQAAVTDAARVAGSGGRVAELASEVAAGGHVAKRALDELIALAADPSAREAVASSGAPRAAATLLRRPSTDETIRGLAGSLLTFLSGMPFAAEVSDVATGAGEHVEVVLPRPSRIYGPDVVAMQLSAGVPPSSIDATA